MNNSRSELNAMAKEKGIKYYHQYSIRDLRVKLDIERSIEAKEYSKGELGNMARDRGYRGYPTLNKSELVEMLGLPKSNQRIKE